MDTEITIPKLGMTMKEATLARWNKANGDWVEEKEVILVIETEKITYEIEAPHAGYLTILEPEGKLLPVGARVGILSQEKPLAAPEPPLATEAQPPPEPVSLPPVPPEVPGSRIKASPLARKLAREHGVDLKLLRGSGPGGRIVRADVLRFLEARPSEVTGKEPTPALPEGPKGVRAVPISGMRRQIMEHMHRSLQETAQMTLTREVDATQLVSLRQSLSQRYQAEGIRISYNALLVKMAARTLRAHPWVNAVLEAEQLIHLEDINIGVAMELEEGLIVPVVRNAHGLTILEIEKTLQGLFERARTKRLLPDEIRGGTFTITNLGHLGIDAFTPILNRPESAILGVGRIIEAPVAVRDEGGPRVEFRNRMMLSLTVDHRILDGAPAARFLGSLAQLIENPILLVE
ncbi:MAG: dihydrolipoamide acetyltransferase family protein [bacterium]